MKNIDIIGVPLKYGADRDGVDLGYHAIQKIDLKSIFFLNKIIKEKELEFSADLNTCTIIVQGMKNKNEIFKANRLLADTVYESLCKHNFPLIIGGDHSLSWGSISGVAKKYDNLGCIYIDAHGDFNTSNTSLSHNVHGMHMSYLMGLVDDELNNWYFKGPKLNKENVFFIGTRSLDKGEKEFVTEKQLNIYSSSSIKANGCEFVWKKIISKIDKSGLDKIHLSIDIDVIDPKFAPGTGVPEVRGLSVEEVSFFIEKIIQTNKIVSIDLVEFNPLLDLDDKTLNCCKEILEIINLNLQ